MTQNRMNCDGCLFKEEGTRSGVEFQLGCFMHKVPITTEKDLTEDGSWVLSGLCQYKRTKTWQWANESLENQMSIARLEARVTFDISFTTSNEPWTENQFDHLRSFGLPPDRITAYYSDPVLYMFAIEQGVKTRDQEHRTLSLDPESDWRVLQGRNCTSTYFGCLSDVRRLPSNFLYWLDHQINDNSYRFAFSSSGEDVLLSKAYFKKVQLSINDLEQVSKKYNSYVDLEFLIDQCKNNKNWNKGELNWI